jgi:type IV pilus assembly protein PilB
MKKNKKIGEIFLELGLISPSQLEMALILQKTRNKPLGKILVEIGFVTAAEIAEALSKQFSIPLVDCAGFDITKDLAALVPREIMEKGLVIPLKLHENKLTVAMANPLDVKTIDELAFVTGRNIHVCVATETSIRNVIDKYLGYSDTFFNFVDEIPFSDKVEFVTGVDGDKDDEEKVTIQTSDVMNEGSHIVKLVTMLLADAARSRASDIHIEPEEKGIQVRYRIDGELKNIIRYPKAIHDSVTTRIKIISELDITNKRLPRDGRSVLRLKDKDIDLRVSTLPTVHGEKIVIRLLDHTTGLVPLGKLGFPEQTLKTILNLISQPRGMILASGPAGSGKSTTLYALIQQLRSETKNIVTIEDPVEYRILGITQVGVHEAIGLTFPTILRHVLRQDPETILVGEIRDLETAEIATRAGLTGHLVLSTIHTNSTVGTITRLLDIGLEPYLVASAVTGILAQSLVRRICPDCKCETEAPEIIASLDVPKIEKFFRGRGCPECRYSGYKGRIGVYELLVVSQQLRGLIAKGCDEDVLWNAAREGGMIALFEDAWSKVEEGITSVDEVIAKISMDRVPVVKKRPSHPEHRQAL